MSVPIPFAWKMEMQFSVGVWTDVAADVVGDEGVRWMRGNTGSGPADHVAQPGTMEFSLRNDARNSGSLQGYYSPGHTNCRTGFTYGIPVRLRVSNDAGTGIYRDLWRGKLRTIDPAPGTYRTQRTHCTAQDCIADLAEANVRAVSPQLNKTEAQLLTAILAALPTEVQPPATSFNTGLDVVPYALDNIGGGVPALQAMSDAVISAFGWLYPLRDGTLKYENRSTRALSGASSSVLGDTPYCVGFTVPNSLDQVFNRVRVTIHPKHIDTAATTVLYAAQTPVEVAPGQTVTVWGRYTDPTNAVKLIGGTAIVDGVLTTTDYTANSLADGTGTNLAASVVVTATGFAADVKFVIVNNSGTMAFVTPQVRGKGIYDNGPMTLESYTANAYGDRPFDLDLPFQDDPVIGQDLADYIKNLYSARAGVTSYSLLAKNDAIFLTAVTTEIGDQLSLSETVTGASSVQVVVNGVAGEIVGGTRLTFTWYLVPQSATRSFILDNAFFGVLDGSGFTSGILGYA